MRKKAVWLGLAGLMLLITSGCSQHLGNFTALSANTYRGENINTAHMVKQNAKGEACQFFGFPKIDEAVSRTLSDNNGDFLANARLYYSDFFFKCFKVEGDVYRTSN